MLDRLIAFAGGKAHIAGGDIILKINKGFGAGSGGMAIWNFPCGQWGPALFWQVYVWQGNVWQGIVWGRRHAVFTSGSFGGTRAASDAFFDRCCQIKGAITSPGIKAGFMCCRWFETQLFVIPLQFATRLRMQMNSW